MLAVALLLTGSLGFGFFVFLAGHWVVRVPVFRTELAVIRKQFDDSIVARGAQDDPDYHLVRGAINWATEYAPYLSWVYLGAFLLLTVLFGYHKSKSANDSGSNLDAEPKYDVLKFLQDFHKGDVLPEIAAARTKFETLLLQSTGVYFGLFLLFLAIRVDWFPRQVFDPLLRLLPNSDELRAMGLPA